MSEEQTFPIKKCILNINEQVQFTKDSSIIFAFRRLFEWANEEGLHGRKVSGLDFEMPNINSMSDPLRQYIRATCLVWLTEKELEAYKDGKIHI